ncbi:Gfo/Idh/MocA family oxidoreductase [Candidatus Beckwithbacteria bacterium]|nr:Gfo/Idh/MocA family oxidoreductase [Candidatus Beckwithbacteria bacterium]
MKQLKLGIIGLSEGNGHPYSWSAIFNGFNKAVMKTCPFPVIYEYLSKQRFPKDAIAGAKVTHIWTQDLSISRHIAKASNIVNIVTDYQDMIGQVDAILLARDDSQNHLKMSRPFLQAGLPIYIDKPLATTIAEAKKMYSLEQYAGQIFTCSALAYAKELTLSPKKLDSFGPIHFVNAITPKYWETYAVHIIEPTLNLFKTKTKHIKSASTHKSKQITTTSIIWDSGLITNFSALGQSATPIKIEIYGQNKSEVLVFKDTFFAFKKALEEFIAIITKKKKPQKKEDVLHLISIIEQGL